MRVWYLIAAVGKRNPLNTKVHVVCPDQAASGTVEWLVLKVKGGMARASVAQKL